MTLHHLDVAYKYSDRMVIVSDHHIYAEGPPKEVFTKQMLKDVYHVDSAVMTDEAGEEHFVILGPSRV